VFDHIGNDNFLRDFTYGPSAANVPVEGLHIIDLAVRDSLGFSRDSAKRDVVAALEAIKPC
jgi:hypothetical protein